MDGRGRQREARRAPACRSADYEKEPGCVAACDANGSGAADVSDAVHGLTHCLLGGAPPSAPFSACGPAALPGDTALGCGSAPMSCP
jgi:hypothetical protein